MSPKVEQIPVPTLPQAPAAPPVMGQQPQGQKPGRKSSAPSFLNAAMSPSKANVGTKQLVGQ